jgi:hypothetical protein
MVQRKRTKGQTMIYKTLHRKLKMEQREPHYKPGILRGNGQTKITTNGTYPWSFGETVIVQ